MPADLHVVGRVLAHRNALVGKVRQGEENRPQLFFDLSLAIFFRLDLVRAFAKTCSQRLGCFLLVLPHEGADRGRVLTMAVAHLADLGLQAFPLVVQGLNLGEIDGESSIGETGSDPICILGDEVPIQHACAC
jgi:hypothetical protein